MADRFNHLDISYDDKRWGNIIDPGEWNQNFHEIENWVNSLVEDLNNGILSPEDMEGLEEIFTTREFVDSLFLAMGQYIDEDVVPRLVKKSGDTLTGALTLSGDPTNPLHAANKGYVDSKFNSVPLLKNVADSSNDSVLLGDVDNNVASGKNSVANGSKTSSVGNYSHSEGLLTFAYGVGSHAEGGMHSSFPGSVQEYITSGSISLTVTETRNAQNNSYIKFTSSEPVNEHGDGWRLDDENYCQVYCVVKFDSNGNMFVQHIISTVIASDGLSGTLKFDYRVNNPNVFSVGDTVYLFDTYNNSFAFGMESHIEGQGCFANHWGHAEGQNTYAVGECSHAEGQGAIALGVASHAEGGNNIFGMASPGGITQAIGGVSHAEGLGTLAIGGVSHSEGISTEASGFVSHAEGSLSKAHGDYSHAEGNNTNASGNGSHTEGNGSKATGSFSHAEGLWTEANHESQHVFGRYNVPDDSTNPANSIGNYVEIVGNGSPSRKANARTLDWNGNEVLAGKLTVGAGPVNAMDVATKQYVDNAILAVVPAPPTRDGVYKLKVAVSGGIPTYYWLEDSEVELMGD